MSHPPTLLRPYGTHCALPHYKVPNDWHPNNTGRAASCQVATHGRKGAWACCSPLAGPLSALFRISPRACAEKMSPTTTSRQQRADTRAWLWAQAIHASWSAASRRAQPERIANYAFWLGKAVASPCSSCRGPEAASLAGLGEGKAHHEKQTPREVGGPDCEEREPQTMELVK
jgi:hypothetical protein